MKDNPIVQEVINPSELGLFDIETLRPALGHHLPVYGEALTETDAPEELRYLNPPAYMWVVKASGEDLNVIFETFDDRQPLIITVDATSGELTVHYNSGTWKMTPDFEEIDVGGMLYATWLSQYKDPNTRAHLTQRIVLKKLQDFDPNATTEYDQYGSIRESLESLQERLFEAYRAKHNCPYPGAVEDIGTLLKAYVPKGLAYLDSFNHHPEFMPNNYHLAMLYRLFKKISDTEDPGIRDSELVAVFGNQALVATIEQKNTTPVLPNGMRVARMYYRPEEVATELMHNVVLETDDNEDGVAQIVEVFYLADGTATVTLRESVDPIEAQDGMRMNRDPWSAIVSPEGEVFFMGEGSTELGVVTDLLVATNTLLPKLKAGMRSAMRSVNFYG